MAMKEKLEQMLANGQDSALLRFSLGELLYKQGQYGAAARHLAAAVKQNADYSAAWKLYGRALLDAGQPIAAVAQLEQGIRVAEANGDNQAAKEMRVFLKRAQRQQTQDKDAH